MKRKIKIEMRGDFYHSKTYPMIRLKGKWLREAGFEAGKFLVLSVTAPGVIELRPIRESPCPVPVAPVQQIELL